MVNTASGPMPVAPVMLREVRIGRISVRNVQALVVPPGAPEGNLLGMSFLDKLDRYEVNGDRLTLIQ
jgi:aspartyl protease family protein